MAKSRRYSKKGRKTMRKKNRGRRVRRGGAAQLPQSERIFPIVTSNVPYSN